MLSRNSHSMDVATLNLYGEEDARQWLMTQGMRTMRPDEMGGATSVLYLLEQELITRLSHRGKFCNLLLIESPELVPHSRTVLLDRASLMNSYLLCHEYNGPQCVHIDRRRMRYVLRQYENIFVPDPAIFPTFHDMSMLGPITYAPDKTTWEVP